MAYVQGIRRFERPALWASLLEACVCYIEQIHRGLTAVLILERRFWVCLNVFKAPPTWGSSTPYLHKIWVNREPVVVLTKRDKQGLENA